MKKKKIYKEKSSSCETRLIAPYLESRRGELIELQMTIRIEGGSIRSKGRRPRNGTFILPSSPPVFLRLPTNES